MSIPFSPYDFFGTLASGAILVLAIDMSRSDINLVQLELNTQLSVLLLLAAYLLGQVNAGFSGWLLERRLTNGLLGGPTDALFGTIARGRGIRTVLFPGYFTPLPTDLQKRILARSSQSGIASPGESLFHHVRTSVKSHSPTWEKMEAFLGRYGFSRNVSCSLLVSAVVAFLSRASVPPFTPGTFALLVFAFATAMYYRYLKFYRQYSYEMYTSYPDIPSAVTKQ